MSGIQKYMTLIDCPYCHHTSATEIARNPRVVRCITCGLYRFLPRMDREGQISYLKQLNDKLDITNYGNPSDPTSNMGEVRELKTQLPEMTAKSQVLDIGTGEGRFLASLRYVGFLEATGLEPMEKLAELGKSAGLDIHTGRFEIDSMPLFLEGRIFDVVCFRESIYYLADLREAFDLLRKVLRPGGILYIKSHVPTSIFYWKSKDYLSRYGPSVSGMPTFKAITNILVNEGYEILKAGYFPFNILHTLGWPFASSFLGTIVGGRILSPVVRGIGKADRLFVFARRL